LIFLGVFRGNPLRADMVLESCTNVVATPFGVTGALARERRRLNRQTYSVLMLVPSPMETCQQTTTFTIFDLLSGMTTRERLLRP